MEGISGNFDTNMEITAATPQDSEFVRWIVFAALDIYGNEDAGMLQVCSEESTLYSWKNTRLLKIDGQPVGGYIAYEGKDYSKMRKNTWPRCWEEPQDVLDSIGPESFPGEFYLDSLAILPQYRGLGLGKKLVLDAIQQAEDKGCLSINLLADKHKSGLVRFYQALGFRVYDSMWYFDHDYWKMKIAFND